MVEQLTLQILDAAIAKVKEFRGKDAPMLIQLNTDDWRKAKDAMRKFGKLLGMKIHVSEDTMWGIPVVELPELPEGTMILVFDKDHYVKVTHIGR